MYRNEELGDFLMKRAWEVTEDWYKSLDKSESFGVYTSTNLEDVKLLKTQNYEFHRRFFQMFIEEEAKFKEGLEEWLTYLANDAQHLATPVHFIAREFFNLRNQYLKLIKEFVSLNKGKYSEETIELLNQQILDTMDEVVTWFMEEHHKTSTVRLEGQQEMINELSSPVIKLNSNVGLLPLVGDIDTARAKLILEKTLKQCSDKRINHLLIDLSGVVMIDTMVAHQIFQIIDALSLIGVKTTLSGIRPEIAQTAVQLGLGFDNVSVVSTLSNAIDASLIQV
ncbi:STAS domain-containing protein [Domibacillus indicus]|uniref:STAS domain-containing protein n=1 Tax=Domibacillus indicus TaxID=1437523 RepID=UPI0006181A3C|nr:STAS domain-containing protein [Domibacillus indicus]